MRRCFPDFLGAEDRLLFERLIRFIHEKPGQPFYASAGLTRVTIRTNSDPRRRVANGSVMKFITSNIPPGGRYNPTACEVNTDYSYAITALDRRLATRFGFKGHRAFCARYLPGDPCSGLPGRKLSSSTATPTLSYPKHLRRSGVQ